MKVLNEIYDFVTGGSMVTPAGVLVAIVATAYSGALAPGLRAGLLLGILLLTFAGSLLEKTG